MRLLLSSDLSKSVHVDGNVQHANTAERLPQAFRKAGLFFALAIGSIFIPVMHFLLVPAFLLISVVAFFRQLKFDLRVKVVKDPTCVKCGNPFKLPEFINKDTHPSCSHCFEKYNIVQDSGESF